MVSTKVDRGFWQTGCRDKQKISRVKRDRKTYRQTKIPEREREREREREGERERQI